MTIIKKYIIASLFCLLPASVIAKSKVDIITTVSVNLINMDMSVTDNISIDDAKQKQTRPDLQGIEVGLTLIDADMYYGFSTQATGQSVADYTESIPGTTTPSTQLNNRSAFNMFAGYRISDKFSVYLGLTKGTSSFGDQMNFNETGPFVGARYAYRINATSSLTFDASYSSLTTDIFLKDEDFLNLGSNNEDGHDVSTDSEGFSYSVTWIRSLDRGRSFFIRLKVQDFELQTVDTDIENLISTPGISTVSGDQKITSVNFGVAF